MMARPGETTSQAAAKLWHVLDSPQQRARRLPVHEHAKCVLGTAES
jgi:hypothetical protein